MAVRLLVVMVLVACGSPQPSTSSRKHDPARAPIGLREVPRPNVMLPDLALDAPRESDFDGRDLRWPLTHPPHRDPHLDLPKVFGSFGPWRSLCTARREPRGVDRDDVLVYLEAWCAHEAGVDTPAKLAPLVKSRSYAIAYAVRVDLVDLLAADPRTGGEALRWLKSNGLADSDQLDALAASYQALDRRHDAVPIVVELRSHRRHHSDADQCRRLLRDHVITRRNITREVHEIRNSTCVRIQPFVTIDSGANGARCPLASGTWPPDVCASPRCDGILHTVVTSCRPIAEAKWRDVTLVAGYQTWPATEQRATVWIEHARFTSEGLEIPGAVELVAAALENAALVADCTTELPTILEVARTTRTKAEHPTLAWLATLTPTTCADRFSPTLGRRI